MTTFTDAEILPDSECRRLIAIARDSSLPEADRIEARNRVIMSMYRYACKLSLRLTRRSPRTIVDHEDLTQAAIIGIAHAIEKFDLAATNTFPTYAGYWVLQAIQHEKETNDATIRRPCGHWRLDRRVNALMGQGATVPETAAALGYSESAINAVLASRHRACALNLDYFPDRDRHSTAELPEEIRDALAGLSARERDVIARRLDGETSESIGQSYNVSKQRVYQIEERAIERIRNVIRARGGCLE